jgi:hypothetical protein
LLSPPGKLFSKYYGTPYLRHTPLWINKEFRSYYERKVKEGKHELSVLNAIKSKIALRAVAVINNQQPHVDNYKKAA